MPSQTQEEMMQNLAAWLDDGADTPPLLAVGGEAVQYGWYVGLDRDTSRLTLWTLEADPKEVHITVSPTTEIRRCDPPGDLCPALD